ncbi:hypothetical protein [Virgisporangium aliadipatigenens]|nr:hypothetical protein [Virgisporangium aliadipatigenens]
METPFPGLLADPAGEAGTDTPFLSQYFADEGPALASAEREVEQLLEGLHDEEFDTAVARLVEQAQARADVVAGIDGRHPRQSEQAVLRYLRPLTEDAEDLLSRLADAVEAAENSAPVVLSAADLDAAMARAEISTARPEPAFEEFLGALAKKAKAVAKVVAKGAAIVSKVLPTGIILRQLIRLVRPLVERVAKLALDRLPPQLREPARQVAQRLLGRRTRNAGASGETADLEDDRQYHEGDEAPVAPAGAEVSTVQQEFDAQAVMLALAASPAEQELLLAESVLDGRAAEDFSLLELDAARDRFAHAWEQLQEDEDPTPLVEQFLPAVLPVLKTALTVIGRDKVVTFLARHLGRLIAPLVGPKISPPLSKAIVDAGMRLVALEADEAGTGGTRGPGVEAVLTLIEDTAAEFMRLSDEDVEVTALLEQEAFAAVGRAARAGFPPVVLRPSARRAGAGGTWVAMPRRGPRRYRKYSRIIDVDISPAAARGIRTRAGRTLSTVLNDRLGHDGHVRARLHLYQVIPGTTPARIARNEPVVGGGAAPTEPAAQLLPLTREAAATLLGDPEFGRDVPERFLGDGAAVAVGQRLYTLEIVDGPHATGLGGTRAGATALSGVTVHEDPRTATATVAIRLSETLAQTVAAQARARRPVSVTLAALARLYDPWLSRADGGRHAAWRAKVRRFLATQLPGRRAELTAAAADPADGLTITCRWRSGRPLELTIVAGAGGA